VSRLDHRLIQQRPELDSNQRPSAWEGYSQVAGSTPAGWGLAESRFKKTLGPKGQVSSACP
jgi:hypothetical protein